LEERGRVGVGEEVVGVVELEMRVVGAEEKVAGVALMA
jgi:hypothetical protein